MNYEWLGFVIPLVVLFIVGLWMMYGDNEAST